MKNLVMRLKNINGSYEDFVHGVINYVEKDRSHLKIILEYLDKNPSASTSDVIAFIASQPDFHEYSAVKNNIKWED